MKSSAVLVLLFAFRIPAQESGPVAPASLCSLEGQVLNAVTGEPLAKVRVSLQEIGGRGAGNNYAASTDSGGRFTLRNVAAARFRLTAERNGFLQGSYGARGWNRPGTPIVLLPGQELRDLTIRLTQQGVITGRVLDEEGEPLTNIRIEVMRYAYQAGRRQLIPRGGAGTNDLGEYRAFGLAPGRYYLSATYHGEPFTAAAAAPAPGEASAEENYVPTYYPGTHDAASAAPLEISPGAQLRGVDFTLLRMRTVRVRGRVTSATGGPLARNAFVMLMPGDRKGFAPGNNAQVRDADGAFELRGVAPGSYILSARVFEDGRNYMARMPVEVGNNHIDNLSLILAPGVDLTGHVGVEGTADLSLGGLSIFLAPRDGSPVLGPGGRARVNQNGTFTLPNVTADNYQMTVSGLPENVYVKSIRLGNEDALENGLNLTRGAGGPLEVLLSPNGGQIEGTVLNPQSQPAGGAAVVLVPEARLRDETRLFKSATTDQTGRFSLKGIAPGEYKVFAWEDIEPGAYQDPDFLKAFENQGQSFSIREGSRENAQLKLIPAEQTPAQVTAANGR